TGTCSWLFLPFERLPPFFTQTPSTVFGVTTLMLERHRANRRTASLTGTQATCFAFYPGSRATESRTAIVMADEPAASRQSSLLRAFGRRQDFASGSILVRLRNTEGRGPSPLRARERTALWGQALVHEFTA